MKDQGLEIKTQKKRVNPQNLSNSPSYTKIISKIDSEPSLKKIRMVTTNLITRSINKNTRLNTSSMRNNAGEGLKSSGKTLKDYKHYDKRMKRNRLMRTTRKIMKKGLPR